MQSHSSAKPAGEASCILVAEDHVDSRDALCTLLRASGYSVLVAGDGLEAVKVAREQSPDLILMDIMMPKLDGFQVIRALRQSDGTRATPIIAVTAMDGADRLADEAGADDMVNKPIEMHSLLTKIDRLLGSRL